MTNRHTADRHAPDRHNPDRHALYRQARLMTVLLTALRDSEPVACDLPPTTLARHPLALHEQLTQFAAAANVNLAANPDAAARLAKLHALAARIETQTRRAHDSLTGACAGLNLLLELLLALVEPHTPLNGPQAPDVLRPLLRSLSRQVADAARAIGALR